MWQADDLGIARRAGVAGRQARCRSRSGRMIPTTGGTTMTDDRNIRSEVCIARYVPLLGARGMVALVLLAAIWVMSPAMQAIAQSSTHRADIEALRYQQRQTEDLHDRARERETDLARQEGKLRGEIAALRQVMISLAKETRGLEFVLEDSESAISALSETELRKRARLRLRRARLAHLLAALQRIALRRPDGLVLKSTEASDLVRSSLLLRESIRLAEQRVGELRSELATLESLRMQISTRREHRNETGDLLDRKKSEFAELLQRKSVFLQRIASARMAQSKAVRQLARDSSNIGELIVNLGLTMPDADTDEFDPVMVGQAGAMLLDRSGGPVIPDGDHGGDTAHLLHAGVPLAVRELPPAAANAPGRKAALRTPPSLQSLRQAPPAGRAKPRSRQQKTASVAPRRKRRAKSGKRLHLTAPAMGRIDRSFGEKTVTGTKTKGVTLVAHRDSAVLAPYRGSVSFAGPFRSYGLIVVIEHPGGYHSVLAGLHQLGVESGSEVRTGEPVGIMGKVPGARRLYFEFRRNGRPINPVPATVGWSKLDKGLGT